MKTTKNKHHMFLLETGWPAQLKYTHTGLGQRQKRGVEKRAHTSTSGKAELNYLQAPASSIHAVYNSSQLEVQLVHLLLLQPLLVTAGHTSDIYYQAEIRHTAGHTSDIYYWAEIRHYLWKLCHIRSVFYHFPPFNCQGKLLK